MNRAVVVAIVAFLAGGALSLLLFARPLCERGIKSQVSSVLGGLQKLFGG